MSWESLNLAATDRRSGSAAVAARAAEALAEISTTLSSDALMDAARLLVQGQPLMAACHRLADTVIRALESDGLTGARRAAEDFRARLEAERSSLAGHLGAALPREGTVLTVSASSTVLEGLYRAPHLGVLCAVSDPGGEGRTAVRLLSERGIGARLIADGAIAQQSTRADAIVLGADVVGPEALLNKSGTLAAALGARSSGRPCLVVTGTSKLVDERIWPRLAAVCEHLAVEGVAAFEEVPCELVTSFVTENGVTSHRALRRATRNVRLHPQIAEWLA